MTTKMSEHDKRILAQQWRAARSIWHSLLDVLPQDQAAVADARRLMRDIAISYRELSGEDMPTDVDADAERGENPQ